MCLTSCSYAYLINARARRHGQDARACSTSSSSSAVANSSDVEMHSIQEPEAETMQELLDLSQEAANTDNEELDPSFDLDTSVKSDTPHQIEAFCEEWVSQL